MTVYYDDGQPVRLECAGCREGGNWHCAGTAPLCDCGCGAPAAAMQLDLAPAAALADLDREAGPS